MRVYAESVSWNASACSPWQTFSSASAVTHHPLHALSSQSAPLVFLMFRGSEFLSVLWPYWLWYWCNYSRSAIFKHKTHMTGFEYDGEVDLGVSLLYFKGWMDYFFLFSYVDFILCFVLFLLRRSTLSFRYDKLLYRRCPRCRRLISQMLVMVSRWLQCRQLDRKNF